MKRLAAILTICFLTLGCSDRDDDLSEANIRIKNVSTLVFDEVQVGAQETLHMNIAPGEYSEYLPYEVAYRIAFISIKAGEETYVLQPTDYVGEAELPVGLYTYELNITAEGGVTLDFSPD